MNGDHKPDKQSYRIERATVMQRMPGEAQSHPVEKWRVINMQEFYFHFDTEADAKDFVTLFDKKESRL